MREAGKGDKQRPTDQKAYSSGYDAIWGRKPDARDIEFTENLRKSMAEIHDKAMQEIADKFFTNKEQP
jgi:hypothetical protein